METRELDRFMRHAAADLLRGTGLETGAELPVAFEGKEPALDSPHHLTAATAAAHAAHASAVEQLWRIRGGDPQQASIDLTQALASLYPSRYQRQWGHAIPMMAGVELKHDFYETADGRWFYPIGSYPAFRNGVLELLGCPNTADAIAKAIRQWCGEELEEEFARRKLVGTYVRSAQEWAMHPQGKALAATPVIAVERMADAPRPKQAGTPARPLEGLRVLDASHVIAGPIVARTLAEQGADVLRVGAPHHSDPLLQVIDTGIGKRSAFVDLRSEAGREKMKELASTADVFVDSWRQGSLARLGFGADDLARLRPGTVHVTVSAYGASGPWAARGGYEQVGQVVSGICHAEGLGGRPRLVPTHFLNDYLTGYLGAAGVASALVQRALHGGTYRVHVSLARTSMWVHSLGERERPSRFMHPFDLQPRLESRDSPFGLLEQLPPVAQFSRTRSCWDNPPVPLGASAPAWKERASA
ncbi:MAG TPA: CoA transferase [Ramlibacter sp.]|nr:CoA transferase [Ramlibacter sp.]